MDGCVEVNVGVDSITLVGLILEHYCFIASLPYTQIHVAIEE